MRLINNIIISILITSFILVLSSFVLASSDKKEDLEAIEYIRTDFSNLYSKLENDDNPFVVRYDINKYIEENLNSDIIHFYNQFTRNDSVSRSIIEESLRNNVPIHISFSVAFTESRFNPRAINTSNSNNSRDYGLFQLNNRYHHLPHDEYFNVSSNTRMGIEYLRDMIEYSNNDVIIAIKAYNAGPTRVFSRGDIPESTYEYAEKILSYEDMLNVVFNEWISENT